MTTVDMCHCTCTGGFAACHTHEDGVVIQPSHSEGEAGLRCSDCGNYLEDYDGPCSNPHASSIQGSATHSLKCTTASIGGTEGGAVSAAISAQMTTLLVNKK